ncbi:MAG: hypothetical protein IJ871_00460 [Ruminococcus sp.]|nr:hypothetical protein [Ruminococcus sp.]
MKRILALLTVFVICFSFASCGKAVDKLNDDEKKILDALTANITTFHDPASVRVIKCSDPFSNRYENFVDTDNYFYYSSFLGYPDGSMFDADTWEFKESENYDNLDCVMIQLNGTNTSGGKSSEVYCLCIDGADANKIQVFTEEINFIKNDNASDEESSSSSKFADMVGKGWQEKQMMIIEAKADKLGYNTASSGSYPISQGNNIDVSKLNAALEEYCKEQGYN